MRLAAPLYVAWETTLDCNARCTHCYSDAVFGREESARWPTDEALHLIEQLAEAGVLILALSGGEVLLRPDWEALVGHAVARGLRVTLATNGLRVTPEVARRLRQLGIWNVSVSIDGATAETHERIRGVPGIFDAACRAVRLLRAEGVRVTVNFTPMKPNFREARGLVELAESLGATKVNLTEYVYLSRGGRELMLGPEELREVLHEWLACAAERRGRIAVDWHDCRIALLLQGEEAERYRGCGAGYTHCRITVDKDVTPCVVLPLPVGNLARQSFLDIWRTAPLLGRVRDRDSITTGNCASCVHKARCGGCRAMSHAHYGHPFGGDPSCWFFPEAPGVRPTNEPGSPE
jgi:AdoMet-dependent heme synthase